MPIKDGPSTMAKHITNSLNRSATDEIARFLISSTRHPGNLTRDEKRICMEAGMRLKTILSWQGKAPCLRAQIHHNCMALEEALADFESVGLIEGEDEPGWVSLARMVLKENRELLAATPEPRDQNGAD